MSKVNLESAQNNIDRLTNNLNELEQLLSSKKQEINGKIKEFNDILGSFFRQADDINQQIIKEEDRKQNNTAELDKLKLQLQELNSKKDILESEIASIQRDIEQLSAIILENERTHTELSVQTESLTERISGFKRKIEEIEVLTQSTNDETKEELRKREIRNADLNEQYNKMISRTKALQYLVKMNIVNLPEIQVIRSLTVPGVDTEENLKKTSGVSDQIIRKILDDLKSREIIAFDSMTGRIQLLVEIDL